MESYQFRKRRKNTKNPLIWKPDKFRFSKDMRNILESKGMQC